MMFILFLIVYTDLTSTSPTTTTPTTSNGTNTATTNNPTTSIPTTSEPTFIPTNNPAPTNEPTFIPVMCQNYAATQYHRYIDTKQILHYDSMNDLGLWIIDNTYDINNVYISNNQTQCQETPCIALQANQEIVRSFDNCKYKNFCLKYSLRFEYMDVQTQLVFILYSCDNGISWNIYDHTNNFNMMKTVYDDFDRTTNYRLIHECNYNNQTNHILIKFQFKGNQYNDKIFIDNLYLYHSCPSYSQFKSHRVDIKEISTNGSTKNKKLKTYGDLLYIRADFNGYIDNNYHDKSYFCRPNGSVNTILTTFPPQYIGYPDSNCLWQVTNINSKYYFKVPKSTRSYLKREQCECLTIFEPTGTGAQGIWRVEEYNQYHSNKFRGNRYTTCLTQNQQTTTQRLCNISTYWYFEKQPEVIYWKTFSNAMVIWPSDTWEKILYAFWNNTIFVIRDKQIFIYNDNTYETQIMNWNEFDAKIFDDPSLARIFPLTEVVDDCYLYSESQQYTQIENKLYGQLCPNENVMVIIDLNTTNVENAQNYNYTLPLGYYDCISNNKTHLFLIGDNSINLYIYDIQLNIWSKSNSIFNIGLRGQACTVTNDLTTMFSFGGLTVNDTVSSKIFEYDIQTDTINELHIYWNTAGAMKQAINHAFQNIIYVVRGDYGSSYGSIFDVDNKIFISSYMLDNMQYSYSVFYSDVSSLLSIVWDDTTGYYMKYLPNINLHVKFTKAAFDYFDVIIYPGKSYNNNRNTECLNFLNNSNSQIISPMIVSTDFEILDFYIYFNINYDDNICSICSDTDYSSTVCEYQHNSNDLEWHFDTDSFVVIATDITDGVAKICKFILYMTNKQNLITFDNMLMLDFNITNCDYDEIPKDLNVYYSFDINLFYDQYVQHEIVQFSSYSNVILPITLYAIWTFNSLIKDRNITLISNEMLLRNSSFPYRFCPGSDNTRIIIQLTQVPIDLLAYNKYHSLLHINHVVDSSYESCIKNNNITDKLNSIILISTDLDFDINFYTHDQNANCSVCNENDCYGCIVNIISTNNVSSNYFPMRIAWNGIEQRNSSVTICKFKLFPVSQSINLINTLNLYYETNCNFSYEGLSFGSNYIFNLLLLLLNEKHNYTVNVLQTKSINVSLNKNLISLTNIKWPFFALVNQLNKINIISNDLLLENSTIEVENCPGKDDAQISIEFPMLLNAQYNGLVHLGATSNHSCILDKGYTFVLYIVSNIQFDLNFYIGINNVTS